MIGQAIIIELVEGTATTGKKSRVCVVVGGLAEGGIGEPIEQPNLAETIRRRFAAIGGVDLEPSPRGDADEPPSIDP